MNIEEEIKKTTQAMNDAEDELVRSGFSEEHWMLIKAYVFSAMTNNQLQIAKAMQEFKPAQATST